MPNQEKNKESGAMEFQKGDHVVVARSVLGQPSLEDDCIGQAYTVMHMGKSGHVVCTDAPEYLEFWGDILPMLRKFRFHPEALDKVTPEG